MSLRWVLLQLWTVQHIITASGTNSCLDPGHSNYRCGTPRIFLTRCGLADDDLPDVNKCLDATLGGRNAVTHVFFVDSDVTTLPNAVFQGMQALYVLAIHDNRYLRIIHQDAFAGSRSLTVLSIVGNGLAELHPETFRDQRASLQLLYITKNHELMNLSAGLFAGLGSLGRLVVSFNRGAYLEEGMLAGLKNLDHLTIVADRLEDLHFNPFSQLEDLHAVKTTTPGDERDNLHCVPYTSPAKIGSSVQRPSVLMVPKKNGFCGDWESVGKGIILSALGEPKSGTTWLGRVIPALAARLCGAPPNQWCRLNFVLAATRVTNYHYDFDMVHAGTGTLFIRFKGNDKHIIPGLDNLPSRCGRGGRGHVNAFDIQSPCDSGPPATREQSLACLPNTTATNCAQHFQAVADPSSRRSAVVMRDPRDVIISEHRMRRDVFFEDVLDLDTFIRLRFETLLAWMNIRWVWHTTTLRESSHVVFLEDFQESHHGLVDLAAFMGLTCSLDQALEVWRSTPIISSHGDYTTYGLPAATLAWMDETMSNLLPQPMLDRWGLATHVSGSLPIDSTSTRSSLAA